MDFKSRLEVLGFVKYPSSYWKYPGYVRMIYKGIEGGVYIKDDQLDSTGPFSTMLDGLSGEAAMKKLEMIFTTGLG